MEFWQAYLEVRPTLPRSLIQNNTVPFEEIDPPEFPDMSPRQDFGGDMRHMCFSWPGVHEYVFYLHEACDKICRRNGGLLHGDFAGKRDG